MATDKIGEVLLTPQNDFIFQYDSYWLRKDNNYPLSLSIPLSSKEYKGRKINAFFKGLSRIYPRDIPPEHQIKSLLKECPGGVSFYSNGQNSQSGRGKYSLLNPHSFDSLLSQGSMEGAPVEENSLGQKMLSVVIHEGNLFVSRDASPSLYLIKSPSSRFQGVIENEYICMTLAKAVGLNVARVKLRKHQRYKYLISERTDRNFPGGSINVIHQERVSQSLGVTESSRKALCTYKNCIKLIDEHSIYPARDKLQLLNLIGFNLIIGNVLFDCDALFMDITHEGVCLAKFSGLYSGIIYEEFPSAFILSVGGEHKLEDMTKETLKSFSSQISLPLKLVKKELNKLISSIKTELDAVIQKAYADPFIDFQTVDKLKVTIRSRCELLVKCLK